MNENERVRQARAHLDWYRDVIFPPGSMLSGPGLNVFLEGWVRVGFSNGKATHHWRRFVGGEEGEIISACSLRRRLTYTNRGQLMVFERGDFPKCQRCEASRARMFR
jgi:hypothetical protein